MNRKQILARIDELSIEGATGGRSTALLVLTGAMTLMEAVYGAGSQQLKALLHRRDEIAQSDSADGLKVKLLVEAVGQALENMKQEVAAGILGSMEKRVTSDVLSDLIQLAREALKETTEGAKNVAAVLAAAAYEDTIRRLAREHAGVIGQDKLAEVITRLKEAGLLVAPQLGIALSYLSFRNHALHAEWEKIDRASVSSALGFVEELLLKHFAE